MTEDIKKLLELVSEDEALRAKAASADKAALIAMAKELGIELMDADSLLPRLRQACNGFLWNRGEETLV